MVSFLRDESETGDQHWFHQHGRPALCDSSMAQYVEHSHTVTGQLPHYLRPLTGALERNACVEPLIKTHVVDSMLSVDLYMYRGNTSL